MIESAVRRRDLFGLALAGGIVATFPAGASLTVDHRRQGWRFCNKCMAMFDTSDGAENRCAAGGSHVPQGLSFRLPYGGRETATTQRRWAECIGCHALFYDGYANKGACPAIRRHQADRTFDYNLPHDLPMPPFHQGDWRFCTKCNVMFFDGYASKGVCAGGGAHEKAGYVFVLPHTR